MRREFYDDKIQNVNLINFAEVPMRFKCLLILIIIIIASIMNFNNCRCEDYNKNDILLIKEFANKQAILLRTDIYTLLSEEKKPSDKLLGFVYDSLPPVPVWTVNCDGSVNNATVTDMPDDDNVRSNLSLIYMHTNESYNYTFDYKPLDIIPGKTPNSKIGIYCTRYFTGC